MWTLSKFRLEGTPTLYSWSHWLKCRPSDRLQSQYFSEFSRLPLQNVAI